MNEGALREALDQLAPDVPSDVDAVLAEVKPGFRQSRRRRRLRVAAGVAAAGLLAAGTVVLAGVFVDDPTTTPTPAAPASTNPPLTTGTAVPFTLGGTERD